MSVSYYEEPELIQETPEKSKPVQYVVGLYMIDKAYGGSEDGGWWYEIGELIRPVKMFRSEKKAIEFMLKLQEYVDRFMNKGRHGTGSVLCEGWYDIQIYENHLPKCYPVTRPYYE